jgi:hypothetical protein
MGHQSGQHPTRKAPDSNRNRCYAVIPPFLRAYLPDAILPRAGSVYLPASEIEACEDGCDRLAQFGVIW